MPLTLKPILPSQRRRLGPETVGTKSLEIFYWEGSRQ